ncbi:hypothetical protein DFH27DRAFT_204234 [Peziza echinospora]|nr:hypothetical protein DFH27DRAFT_204234 [Peziza echinospora]
MHLFEFLWEKVTNNGHYPSNHQTASSQVYGVLLLTSYFTFLFLFLFYSFIIAWGAFHNHDHDHLNSPITVADIPTYIISYHIISLLIFDFDFIFVFSRTGGEIEGTVQYSTVPTLHGFSFPPGPGPELSYCTARASY